MKNLIKLSFIGFLSGIIGAFSYHKFSTADIKTPSYNSLPVEYNFTRRPGFKDPVNIKQAKGLNEDLVTASSRSRSSVVYIKTLSKTDYGRRSWLEWFFEGNMGQMVSSGSGVIYTTDGYIITNNHVIEDADNIEVIHGKHSYQAVIIGADPSTDIAVLKVEASNLSKIDLGSSRELKVGEWVLAVGNPFNLTSTVTAGIVSAKGRDINILRSQFPIESFIQTDAAINPGNSGGALVNIKGELVGINTAILSKTGSYAGYGFAVPVDIVKKVVDDIIKYGEVQKAFWGADVINIDQEVGEKLGLDNLSGVVMNYIQRDGAAHKAGLEKGDIILKLDNQPVNSKSEFEEVLSYHSPGDKVTLLYKRNGKMALAGIVLTNKEGTTDIIVKQSNFSKTLGAEFESVPKVERELLNIDYGVRVTKVKSGFLRSLGIEEDFIITHVNNEAIKDPKRLIKILEGIRGRVIIEGVNKRGVRGYYSFYF
ncbi:MAG: trypsin-like peptidase domain-containing protein [Bacteroidetes bacterium]|nr:trypsin-like peptidase domain-containing protein [Bacteroidota bacterium]